MRVWSRVLLVLASIVLIPSLTYAQASIAGTVKDASGAVLPGVTVEASSPALIERTRSVVTCGASRRRGGGICRSGSIATRCAIAFCCV